MKTRKIVAIFMIIAMVFCYMPVTALADVASDVSEVSTETMELKAETTEVKLGIEESKLLDMPKEGFWSTVALKTAVSNGLLNGFVEKDGTYIKPNESLTRAQMATIVNRAFGAKETSALSGVMDVPSNAWYFKDMQKAVKMGTMKLDTNMRPNDSITRQEAFAILGRALKMEDGTNPDLTKFHDASQVANWAISTMGTMVKAGYIKGDNNLLNPTDNMTRAQFAVIMNNVIKEYISNAGTFTEIPSGNITVNVPGVTLKDLTITGDLIVGDGVGDGNLTLNNVVVKGNLIIRGGGIDSIIIIGGSVNGKVIIAKIDGNVRVFAEDGAEIEVIEVSDGKDNVIIEGTVGTLEITSPNTPVIIRNANVKTIEVNTQGAGNITVANGSKVNNIVVGSSSTGTKIIVGGTVTNLETSAPDTEISGAGTVTNVKVNNGANGTSITTPNTKIDNKAEGVTGGGGDKILRDAIVTNNTQGTGIIASTSGGSSSGSSAVSIAVSAITVTGEGDVTTITTDKGTLQMKATVTPEDASNKAVTWSVENGTGEATISATGLLTAVKDGTVTVKATAKDGSGVVGEKPITISGQLSPSTIVFADGAAVSKVYGTTGYINAVSGDGDGAVTYSSGTPATATINTSTGEVTIVGVGTTVITAVKAATATHGTVTNTYTLTVTKAPSTIVFAEGATVSKVISAANFTNAVSGEGTGAVDYSSGTPGTATINSSTGEVTIKAVGTTVITAVKAATSTHATVTATYTLTVAALTPSTIVFTDGATVSKVYGEPAFTNTVSGAGDGAVTYLSGTPATATIDTNGEVTIVGVGTTVITATKAATATHATVTNTYTLTVTKKELTVSGLSAKYNPGATAGTGTVTIEGTPALVGIVASDGVTIAGTASGSISGSSSSETVAITGLSLAGAKAGNYTLSLPTDLIVNATTVLPASEFSFADESVTKVYGDTPFTNPVTNGDGAGAITYSSETPATATINETTGEVTIVGVGTTVITAVKAATTTHATVTETYTLTVTAAPLTGIAAISGTAKVGETLTAGSVTPSEATFNYQWVICDTADGTYANIDGATNSTYTILAENANKFIKVVATGTDNYGGSVTSAATVKIENAEQTAPTGLAGVAPTSTANNDGKITGTTAGMEYKLATESIWTPATATEITKLAAGTYNVRYAAKTGYNASPETSVIVDVYIASTDASLSDLKVDGTTITGFNASTLTYNVELPAGTTTVPTVTATANDSKASAVVTNASSLPGSTTVAVTAEDGTTKTTYTINFTVAADTTPPVITASDKILPIANLAAWTGTVSANDDVDGNITSNIVATYFESDGSTSLTDLAAAKEYIGDASVNTSFIIKYNVSDAAGNAATEVTVTITVTKANVPSSITLGSSILNSTNPYLVNGVAATTGTLGADNCTARFDSLTGVLSLHDYVGGVIRINETGKDLRIKLIGNYNKITGGQFGIYNDKGDIYITSDNEALLEIERNSSSNGAAIANGWGAMTEKPSVFIGGKVKLTIKAEYTGEKTTDSITGIYAGRGSVIIQDQADYFATLTNSKYQGRGIYSNGKTIINTSGNIGIDVSNSLQGIGIYGNSGIEIQQVNSMLITIPSTGGANTKFTSGTVNVSSGVAVNKSATEASYRSGTPYTLELVDGNITLATGEVIGSPNHQYLKDDEITIQSTISNFDRWTKADGTALEESLFTGSYTENSATATIKMPAANLSIKAKEKDAKISIAEIPGVTAPVTGATPVTTEVSTDQYTGTVAWTPADNPFAAEKVYTATITLKAKSGFTLDGVATNFFTVNGIATTHVAGVVTVEFPVTVTAADVVINMKEIPGVTTPVTGATPVTTSINTTQYTGTVVWNESPVNFAANTVYTATITLTPKTGYTLTGVTENLFTVGGATATNAVDSGVVIAVFPATADLQDGPPAPAVVGNGTDENKIVVTHVDSKFTVRVGANKTDLYEYSIDGGTSWTNLPKGATTSSATTSIKIRVQATEISKAGEATEVVANANFVFNNTTNTIMRYIGSATSIDIPVQIGKVDVKVIGEEAFKSKGLTSANILASLTNIEREAFNYNGLTSIIIPASVTTIGAGAFRSNKLTSIEFIGEVASIVTFAFNENGAEGNVNGDSLVSPYKGVWEIKENKWIKNNGTDFAFNEGTGTITGYTGTDKVITIPEMINGVTVKSIGSYSLSGKYLTSVSIPDTVTSIGDRSFNDNNLTSLTIGSSVTSIGNYAFAYNKLVSITIPASVTSIGYQAFHNNKLTDLYIPNSVTSIGYAAFNNNQLEDAKAFIYARISGGAEDTAKLISYGGDKKEGVVIPASVTEIGEFAFSRCEISSVTIQNTVTSIGRFAFEHNKLTEITIPSSVTSIEKGAFNNNELPDDIAFIYARKSDGTEDIAKLVSYGGAKKADVVIPSGIQEIGESAFSLSKLTSVTIPNTVTIIRDNAFYYNDLTSIIIPEGVTTLESGSFRNNKLISVTIPATVTTIGGNVFQGNGPGRNNDNFPSTDYVGTWKLVDGSTTWTKE